MDGKRQPFDSIARQPTTHTPLLKVHFESVRLLAALARSPANRYLLEGEPVAGALFAIHRRHLADEALLGETARAVANLAASRNAALQVRVFRALRWLVSLADRVQCCGWVVCARGGCLSHPLQSAQVIGEGFLGVLHGWLHSSETDELALICRAQVGVVMARLADNEWLLL